MAETLGTILVVDDDGDVLTAAKLLLKQCPYTVLTETDPSVLPDLLKRESPDVILLDMNFTRDVASGVEGFHWLGKILSIDPSAIVILITSYGDVETAVRAVKAGATDFILKPWQNEKLLATLSSAMRLRGSKTRISQLEARQSHLSEAMDQPYHEMIGASPPMQSVFKTIAKVAATDANVLILGENGTGKELVARAIHRQSRRVDGVFISVDIGAVSESLFESELFGHVKGAFTDARSDRMGRFELADGGTLFLDEIGNVPLAQQAKLLRVLQTGVVERVGSAKNRKVDVRIVAATNTDLKAEVAAGRFREDLLFRLNTIEIHLAPLRDRREDIPPLARHFLTRHAARYRKNVTGFAADALRQLLDHPWPGNVRELDHAIERAVLLAAGTEIGAADLALAADGAAAARLEDLPLEDVEKVLIRKALERFGGNVSHAAEALGLSRSALYRRLQHFGL